LLLNTKQMKGFVNDDLTEGVRPQTDRVTVEHGCAYRSAYVKRCTDLVYERLFGHTIIIKTAVRERSTHLERSDALMELSINHYYQTR
jgi:hypothetical protein